MKIIIIDDDPTGSQTVHDCLLLLKWDYKTLLNGLKSTSNLLFILANTRALSEQDVKQRLEEICFSLKNVLKDLGLNSQEYLVISRGDSTLRGHNFLEPNTLNKLLGPFDVTFHIPAFIEANRVTINGEHLVNNIPIHKTIFAKDKIFGFDTSNIKKILYEKCNKEINFNQIKNLSIKDIELLSPEEDNKIYNFIKDLNNNTQVIVDIANYSQLDKFASVVKRLHKKRKFLFRTAASFINSISQINKSKKDNIYYSHLRRKNNNNQFMKGLIVVGSYVDMTTLQLQKILEYKQFQGVELDVINFYKYFQLQDNANQVYSLKRLILDSIRAQLKEDLIPILYTSRKIIVCRDNNELIKFQNYLSLFIAEIVSEIKLDIGYLISKGGITTNTILSQGFNIDFAYLEGQIFPGISLVTISITNKKDRLPIVTFPGNLGEETSLFKLLEVLENRQFTKIKNY